MDPIMPVLAATGLGILLLAALLRRARMSVVSGYLLAGVVLGPAGLGVVSDEELLTHLGAIGVLLLLFFAGMEVSLPKLVAGWRVAIVGGLTRLHRVEHIRIPFERLLAATWSCRSSLPSSCASATAAPCCLKSANSVSCWPRWVSAAA
jgi:predicted Kef-type K+ transport protein